MIVLRFLKYKTSRKTRSLALPFCNHKAAKKRAKAPFKKLPLRVIFKLLSWGTRTARSGYRKTIKLEREAAPGDNALLWQGALTLRAC